MTLRDAIRAAKKINPETRTAIKSIKRKEDWIIATLMVSDDTGFEALYS